MKWKILWKAAFFSLLLSVVQLAYAGVSREGTDKAAFYAAMTSGNLDDIDRELAALSDSEQGYTGALLIRKASLAPKVREKLKLFKQGRAKLEAALTNEPENTEYHFLRLSIQEHAPKIVNYKANLQADKDFLIKHFSQLSLVVQRAVKDYCKNSRVLKPGDFNTDHS